MKIHVGYVYKYDYGTLVDISAYMSINEVESYSHHGEYTLIKYDYIRVPKSGEIDIRRNNSSHHLVLEDDQRVILVTDPIEIAFVKLLLL